jgi:hypothetical protein
MTAIACIGEPISWLRLETYALEARDAAVGEHVASCRACARCLDEIRADVVALPVLALPAAPARSRVRRWWLAAPAFAVAAVLALVLWRGLDPGDDGRDDTTHIKGVGEVVLGLVRERAGAIRFDVQTYAPGDRWKVIVTCAPGIDRDIGAWVDASVDDAGVVDYPLAPARIACGNRVAVPGAFAITGDRTHQVCIRVAADAAPERRPPRIGEPGVACLRIRPE